MSELKQKMEVGELSPAELAKARAKLKPVLDKYSANVGDAFAKKVFAEIEKVRAGK